MDPKGLDVVGRKERAMGDRRIEGPHPRGGWHVKAPRARRATAVRRTRGGVIERAHAVLETLRSGGLA